MKKIILSICTLFLTTTAFAQTPELFDAAMGGKMKKCAKESWNASSPSDSQKMQAAAFYAEAKAVYEMHKEGLKSAKAQMHMAWMKHPLVRDEVIAAESSLLTHFMPVKDAFRDAGLYTLNVLDPTQRAVFNNAFHTCLKGK